MKAAVWHNNADIRIEEIPTPRPAPREMLVKVFSCGICGSDVVEWYRLPRAPLVQGHEIGAQVAEVGELVKDYRPGDRVFIAPKVPCGSCHYCEGGHFPACPNVKERLGGGFAQYILVPQILVEKGTYRIEDSVTYDQSTFIEPLACAMRAQSLSAAEKSRTILVMGCGMSGLLHIKLARTLGARIIATDINDSRLELAKKVGADFTINAAVDASQDPAGLMEQIGKVDIVMICTSALSAVEQAWRCVDRGGAVVFFAVPGPEKQVAIPINDFWTKEIRVLTSYYCGPDDIEKAMRHIEDGAIEVEDLVTHRLPLKDTAEGFRLVLDGRSSIKVIIRPNE